MWPRKPGESSSQSSPLDTALLEQEMDLWYAPRVSTQNNVGLFDPNRINYKPIPREYSVNEEFKFEPGTNIEEEPPDIFIKTTQPSERMPGTAWQAAPLKETVSLAVSLGTPKMPYLSAESDVPVSCGGEEDQPSGFGIQLDPLAVFEWIVKHRAKRTPGYMATPDQHHEGDDSVTHIDYRKPPKISLVWSENEAVESGQPENEALKKGFAGALAKVNMTDILRLIPGRSIPKNMDAYRLVPIVSGRNYSSTIETAGQSCLIPDGVTTNYHGVGGRPYLDASLAIGLVYKDTLAAVAAAGVNDRGRLSIVQLQDVTLKTPDDSPRARFKSGLHNGFFWRDTLVQAWLGIAAELGINDVEVQSAKNNRWHSRQMDERLVSGYDKVAERMGFIKNDETNNWDLPNKLADALV